MNGDARINGGRRRHDQGFTLIELLIVIVILGVLAAVVVFAVGGITDQGESSSMAADERTIVGAEETHFVLHGQYASEDDLVTAGLLHGESSLHDITLAVDGSSYTIEPASSSSGGGGGGGGGPTTTSAPSSPTTTAPPAPTTTLAPAPVSYAGFSGQATGTGSKTLVIIGRNGGGSTQLLFDLLTHTPPADTRVIWLDGSDVNDTGDVQAVINASPNYMVAADMVPISSGSGSTYVGQYMSTLLDSPDDYWWTHDLGNPSLDDLEAHL
jgi:general secretion pathway protein G